MNFLSIFKFKNDINKKQVIVRFAPSPTGFLHLGSARTALFNYIFTKQNNGKFILRMEDTDKERSESKYEKDILDGLSWLGIKYDGEVKKQSERTDIYRKYLQKMLGNGSAYEAEDNKNGTGKIIRFKNPNTKIKFNDLIRGEIEFDTTELKDFVIAKDINTPLYHLAVVVDDLEMSITHIIRGDDGISNTPRQILIQGAIGAVKPIYAHIPLILASDKSKLSKRHGAVSVNEYKNMGYLPQAMVNFLALIGWHPKDDKEIFTIDELTKEFNIGKVQKGGAIFNQEKLNWINKEYIKKLDEDKKEQLIFQHLPEEIKTLAKNKNDVFKRIVPIIIERINKFSDIKDMSDRGELKYFFQAPEYDKEKITWKDSNEDDTKVYINKVKKILQKNNFTDAESVKEIIWDYAEEKGRGNVLWPIRYALSGLKKSPDPFTLVSLLGKDESISRLEKAIKLLSS
jgi:glutamyl-tRNA synthetase